MIVARIVDKMRLERRAGGAEPGTSSYLNLGSKLGIDFMGDKVEKLLDIVPG